MSVCLRYDCLHWCLLICFDRFCGFVAGLLFVLIVLWDCFVVCYLIAVLFTFWVGCLLNVALLLLMFADWLVCFIFLVNDAILCCTWLFVYECDYVLVYCLVWVADVCSFLVGFGFWFGLHCFKVCWLLVWSCVCLAGCGCSRPWVSLLNLL